MKLKSTSARVLSSRGFTLVELMVTILVVSILAAIAIPTYSAQIRKSRRTEARTALLDAAAREEQFYATHNLYTETPADLGYPAFPAPVGGSYYTLDVKCSDKTCANGFTATASPTGTQLKDTTCTAFTVTQTGLQGATPGANAATACWNRSRRSTKRQVVIHEKRGEQPHQVAD